ncbi:hypothetical protein AB0D14_21285 [Streptomyces sp. NPDC048484]|uniref:hypothetical protein n=1 Tax=Streptomyces sp. NPDC048484 TaxID=3155146 RepID=UPI003424F833
MTVTAPKDRHGSEAGPYSRSLERTCPPSGAPHGIPQGGHGLYNIFYTAPMGC